MEGVSCGFFQVSDEEFYFKIFKRNFLFLKADDFYKNLKVI